MTKIEWVKNPDGTPGKTINEITGCLNCTDAGLCRSGLFPCYAWRLANTRLKERYLANTKVAPLSAYFGCLSGKEQVQSDSFYPRLWLDKFDQIRKRKKPTGYFHCDMSDWCGIGIPPDWSRQILDTCAATPWHRHYLLTKQPQNLQKFTFPDSCYVGVTVTNQEMFDKAIHYLKMVDAKVKFLSIEPLLEQVKIT